MLSVATCANVPVRGGRGVYGDCGGLVEVEGRVVWGGVGYGRGVYMLDEVRSEWSRVADRGEWEGTLAVCGGRLVWVGGWKGDVMSKEVKELRGGRWSIMSDMLVGCRWSCVLSASGGGMVVMGGEGDGRRWLNDVQVFDGGTQTWHRGPSLPKPCCLMSAVVHGELVFVMGGLGMDRAVWCADIRDLQSIWRQLPDVPYYFSSVCVGDGVLLAIGGADQEYRSSTDNVLFAIGGKDQYGSKQTSSIYGLHGDDKTWKHVGDMPFACSRVDTLLLSDGGLLMVDGNTHQVLKITVQGLAKLFPITLTVKETGKSHKEADERLYEEAMSKGYVETSVTKCLILGAAGVGKTHLKHLLLKKDPPGQRVSTGLADNPVRAISFSLAGVSVQEDDDWFVVEDDQSLLRVVGGTIRDGGVSMTTSLEEVVSSFPKMTIHVSSDGAGAVHPDPTPTIHVSNDGAVSNDPDPTPARVNTTMDSSQQSRTVSIEEELIHHINHSSGTIRDGGVSMTTSLEEVVSSFPKMTIHVSSDGAGAVHPDPTPTIHVSNDGAVSNDPDPTPARVNTTMDSSQQSRTVSIEEELIHHINHSSDKKKLFGVKWIHFIDSGGQLQYHDILPLFIQKPAVAIFVLNLSEELCHQPTIEYYGADGKPVSRPYRSSLSHKQILQHCLGAMCSQDARPVIITVGTHRDAADRCSESIAEKSQKLKALLDAGSFRIVCIGEKLKEVIFAVNGKTPQDEDRHVAKVLREEIISVCPQPIKMPIAWFGLEVLLQRSSHDGILSLVECQGCAKRLHIEGDAFSAALHHLVHNNVFLHYPEDLPQTVFCDPQVVLTKVSEIVEYHHKLLYLPAGGVATKEDLVKFRDHGLLSVELLNKFSKHYTEGLFIAQDLLKLLVSVGAIAMVGDEGIEYLMPALLPHLDSGQVTKYCQPGTSLIIMPSQGCIPSGLFCCLVAQLLSPTNHSPWKVCMDAGKPLCLYRNCITFDTTEIVTLVDMFSYIVLHVDEMSSEVCREIRGCVHSAIKTACGILKYQGVLFEDAFMCAGASCTSNAPHLATVVSKKKWKCSIRGHQRGDLSEGQLMWFGGSGVMKQDPSAAGTVPVTLDSEPSLQHLMEKVAAVIPSKYEMVGLQLGLTLAQLQAIRQQHQSLGDYHRAFGEIFNEWRRQGSPPYTWGTLTGVLRSASVGEVLLSEHCSAVMAAHVPRTLLIQDPRDAYPPPSTLQPTQSFLETAGKSLTLYMIGSSRLHRKMLETSRVEIDELPASIPWIVFDKARTVVKLFHTRRVHEDGRADALCGPSGILPLPCPLRICSHVDQLPNEG
eukprot:Em0002g228a